MYVSKVYQYPVDAYGDVRTLVRGITFQCPDDWEGILDSLDEDSNLYLIKEPDNPKDKLAIAAYLDDRRVGYVAASDNGKIWLYMTDEKMPCQFLERFEASFKIVFENPRPLFEEIPFKEIYKDNKGLTERNNPSFRIPFFTNPKDKSYDWFDDKTYIADLEWFIPDFRRKLATRMIILLGRKNSKGEYCYYLPYINEFIAYVEDALIQDLIDRHGFVIALPDVPMMTHQDSIFMDLHVTFLKNTDYKNFDSAHHSELVFSLTKDYDVNAQKATGVQNVADGDEYNSVKDLPDDGKLVSMNFKTIEETMDYVEETVYSDADNDLGAEIVNVVNDYLSGESPTPYQVLVIPQGETVLYKSVEGKDIAKSTNVEILELAKDNRGAIGYITYVDYDDYDGEILVYRVTIWVSRSFPRFTQNQESKTSITSTKSNTNLPSSVNDFFPIGEITLGVTTWKQVEEKGYVVEVWEGGPSRYTKASDFTFWDHKGQGVFTNMYKTRSWHDNNLPQLWESKGFFWNNSYDQWIDVFESLGFDITVTKEPNQREYNGHKTLSAKFEALSPDKSLLFTLDFSYGRNGHHTSSSKTLYSINVQYKGSVAVETSQIISEANEKTSGKVNRDEKDSSKSEIQDAVFYHCIFEVLGVDLTNTPNSKWKYESWNVFGGNFETYVFSAPDVNAWKLKKCEAIVNRNRNTNYKFKELNANSVLSLLYQYRKVYDSSYRYERCKEEYLNILDDSIGHITLETNPWLSIRRSDGYSFGDSKTAKYDVLLFTSKYNKEYIDELIFQKKLITIF